LKFKYLKREKILQILEKLSKIYDTIPEPFYFKDNDNNYIKVNEYYAKCVGYQKEKLENHNAFNIFSKTFAQKNWEHDYEVIEKKKPKIATEQEWITKTGKKWIICHRIPIIDKDEQPLGVICIAKDITEQKVAEKKLKESEEQFRIIAEQSVMGICIIQDNRFKYLNKRMSEILGYKQEQLKQWGLEDMKNIIHPEDQETVINQLLRKQQGSKDVIVNYRYRIVRNDNSVVWLDNYSKSIQYKGRPADLITVGNITKNVIAQQELVRLNKLRSELLSSTSHELKTPLTVIKGYIELLKKMKDISLNENVKEILEMIDKGVIRLEKLIENILDAAKVKAHKLKIEKSTNNLTNLIHACVNELEGMLKLRNHNLTIAVEQDLIIEFDWEALFQVLRNIISNAIKFTPPYGAIDIKSEKTDVDVIISIKDNGIGFEPEERQFLFSEFGKIKRLNRDLDIITEGSGLGLYISKSILELHGGKIWMESEGRDKGSTFYFSLPISAV
jgi:hypothetical protein